MTLIQVDTGLERELREQLEGEVRFDDVTRAIYSTDASIYQIKPQAVVIPKSKQDIIRTVKLCRKHHTSLTMRGGGTAQAGQSIGPGIIADTSKYFNQILELNVEERWVRVESGIVLDELNAHLKPHNLRFAPDVSTASRATIGGMMANNSSGARSVYYGKTIDHVLEQQVILSNGEIVNFSPKTKAEVEAITQQNTLEAACYRTLRQLGTDLAEEVDRRFPKVLRRVGGYNLDEFTSPDKPFNLAKLMVGSEGTLGIVLEAKLNLVPLPRHKAVMVVQFHHVLDALGATPAILKHGPSAIEVMDSFILDHTHLSPTLQRLREVFVEGNPGAILCIEFYDDTKENLPQTLAALEQDLIQSGAGYRYYKALEPADQARVWTLREAALGLSMTMKEDAKSLSFVEDTAVAPEKLRDYIERFLAIIRRHETSAGIYAHASVGCLHVRPVINMKTAEGLLKFEAIANEVADLVLEFGGALSGEHGDGMVRSPFMEKMFGPVLYQAFRTIKRTFDPDGVFNPRKITDSPPLLSNLRFGAGYKSPTPRTFFDYSEHGGFGGAVEMCSGLGACRKTLEGTMCPSYMVTRDELDVTRGRANALRQPDIDDAGLYKTLDLCLECRACKSECPVGVDMARFKSEFLARYWQTYGTPLHAKVLGNVRTIAKLSSHIAGLMNWASATKTVRVFNEAVFGLDQRRTLPALAGKTFTKQCKPGAANPDVLIFNDTFTNYYDPEIGLAAWDVIEAAGQKVALAPNHCCGRPLISKGLLKDARKHASLNTEALYEAARSGQKLVFCEPSCLSAIKEDAPSLLRGEEQQRAQTVADAAILFEDYAATLNLNLKPGPPKILLHGHCHQKSMGLLPAAKALLARIPGTTVIDSEAGCCGMAGSFGYSKEHFDVSRQIGERRLLPLVRAKDPSTVVVAAGTSCRHQIDDFTGEHAIHPAVLLRSLLR